MSLRTTRRGALTRLGTLAAAAAAGAAAVSTGSTPARAQNREDPWGWAPRASLPAGYPAHYLDIIRAAEDEAQLTLYSTTDEVVAQPLLDDFRQMYPRIAIDYDDQTGTELNHRFIAETQLGRDGADVLWSSAMDQQALLIERGDALPYDPVEADGLPTWARLANLGWSTTLEPIAIVYDRRQLSGAEVPASHADLRRLLEAEPARFDRKLVLYDATRSGVGYLLATHDAAQQADYWAMMTAIGRSRPRTVLTVDAMLSAVEAGRALIAYNVLGDYARARASRSAALGVVLPSDYTLVLSRVMFISRHARHPNAARLWVDYLLSQRGQTVLANRSQLHSVRADVGGRLSADALRRELGERIRPIAFEPRLAEALRPERQAAFTSAWHRAMGRTLAR